MHLSSIFTLLTTTAALAYATPLLSHQQTPFVAPSSSNAMSSNPTVLLPHTRDHATYSNYEDVRTQHLHLDWTIDWEKQLVGGSVGLEMEVLAEKGVEEVVLDVREVDVKKVELEGKELKVSLVLYIPDEWITGGGRGRWLGGRDREEKEEGGKG